MTIKMFESPAFMFNLKSKIKFLQKQKKKKS